MPSSPYRAVSMIFFTFGRLSILLQLGLQMILITIFFNLKRLVSTKCSSITYLANSFLNRSSQALSYSECMRTLLASRTNLIIFYLWFLYKADYIFLIWKQWKKLLELNSFELKNYSLSTIHIILISSHSLKLEKESCKTGFKIKNMN